MAASTNGDSASASVPFSYAQAAKGRAAAVPPTSHPATSPLALPLKESTNWADDSLDTQIALEEHQSNGVENGTQAKSHASEKTSLNGHRADTTSAASHPSSPHYDSTATTAKEDEISSPVKALSESIWDRQSSSSQAGESLQESGKAVEPSQDSTKDAAAGQADLRMKEAPAPMVNIWQKRAEEAKAKQHISAPTTGGTPSDAAARRPSQTTKPNSTMTASTPRTSQESSNGTDTITQDASLPTSNKARGPKPGRAQKPELAPLKSVPPPPPRDEIAWPTPLTVRDEDRRKAQQKEDKTEKERPQSATSKPHGKNEWIHVPIQHSVKYNTPLPPTRGRGGRGGSRGGRGGSAGERGSAQPNTAATREESAAVEPRGRFDNDDARAEKDARRSSVQAPDGSRTSSASQAGSNEKQASATGTNKRQSLRDDTMLPPPNKSTQTGHRPARQFGSEPASVVTEPAVTFSGRNVESAAIKPKSNGADTSFPDRRRSLNTQPEGSADGVQQARPKRASYQWSDDETTAFADRGFRPQASGPDQLNIATKPTRPDYRSGGSSRSFENWGSLPMRDGRLDRGRGRGGRGSYFSVSHHASGQSQNTPSLPPLQTSTPYSAKSPSVFQSSYFPQTNAPAGDRNSFPPGPRPASITTDSSYGRFGQAYPGSQQYPMYSPYLTTPYEYSAAAMSAVPYTPSMEQNMVIINGVAFQLNYYFSLENLLKDVYLRKHMDSKGFVSLNFIANFQRMKDLTTDLEIIKYACLQSPDFELRQGTDGQIRIRTKDGWDKWVLSMDERDPSAQNDGPPTTEQTRSQPSHGFDMQSASRPPFPDMMSHGVENNISAFGMAPSFQPLAVSSPNDVARNPGEIPAPQSQPALGNNVHGSQYASTEQASNGVGEYGHDDADSFPNSRIPFLTVAVRPMGTAYARRPSRSETSRTFSNGSISAEELNQPDDAETRSQSQAEDPAEGDQLQKMLNARKPLLTPSGTNNEASAESVELFWFKGHEARQPLPFNGNTEFYLQLHFKALEERQHAEPGTCPHDLDVLYQFWSHFLIRNFNTTMYSEFRQLAHDDASQGMSNVGMQSLITFYSEALSSQQPIRDRVARHYVSLVKNEDSTKGRPAFEQLKSAWRNGALNMKNRKRIASYVDRELRDELDKLDR